MFDFLSKKCYLADQFDDFCDVHSHLLWGVDDGSENQQATDRLADEMAALGFSRITLTPHIIYGLYGNQDEATLRARFAEFTPHPKIEYRLAAEYFLDEHFISHVNSDEPLLTMGGDWLLTEFALQATHLSHLDDLFEVALSGHNVIIAHPERYAFTLEDRSYRMIEKLTACNYCLQLNLLSLTGYHGPRVKRAAEEMLLKNMYTFVGSDTHSRTYTETLKTGTISPKCVEPLKRLMENNRKILWKWHYSR